MSLLTVEMLKRERERERVRRGKQRKATAAWISEFAVENLPLSRTPALVPEFALKDLPCAEHSDDIYIHI